MKITFSQLYVYVGREPLTIKEVTVSVSFFHCDFSFVHYTQRNRFVKIVFVTISLFAQQANVVQRDVQEG